MAWLVLLKSDDAMVVYCQVVADSLPVAQASELCAAHINAQCLGATQGS